MVGSQMGIIPEAFEDSAFPGAAWTTAPISSYAMGWCQNSDGSVRVLLKQSLQYTGRSPRGLKGTMASAPQSAQTIGYISRGWSENEPPRCSVRRTARQLRHRLGSLENPRALKNSCSPAVKINSPPHSTQINVLSDSATG